MVLVGGRTVVAVVVLRVVVEFRIENFETLEKLEMKKMREDLCRKCRFNLLITSVITQ